MAFRPPAFNLPVSLWHSGPAGITSPYVLPDLTFTACLSFGRRVAMEATPIAGVESTQAFWMELLCPALTDIRDQLRTTRGSDLVEVPAGSHRFYFVEFVDDVAKGFTNEYRIAILQHAPEDNTGVVQPFGFPYPTPLP